MPGSFIGFKGDESERFWRKVSAPSLLGCWEWTAGKTSGYGTFAKARIPGAKRNIMVKAHRWLLENVVGVKIPDGMEPDHLCRNPGCVSPFHLEIVTPKVNNSRGTSPCAANGKKIFCDRGHNNWRKTKKGRDCITCRATIHTARKLAVRRAANTGKIRKVNRTRIARPPIVFLGKIISAKELSRISGVNLSAINDRVYRIGMTPERAMFCRIPSTYYYHKQNKND